MDKGLKDLSNKLGELQVKIGALLNNTYTELPKEVKSRYEEEAHKEFNKVSKKVLTNEGETFKKNFIDTYIRLKSDTYFSVERDLVIQDQLIQGFEEREKELLEQIENLKRQIRS
jgi:hypothetical protein